MRYVFNLRYLNWLACRRAATKIMSSLRCKVFDTGCPAISSRIMDLRLSAWYVMPFSIISRMSSLVKDRA